jgi:hypothetical protein
VVVKFEKVGQQVFGLSVTQITFLVLDEDNADDFGEDLIVTG